MDEVIVAVVLAAGAGSRYGMPKIVAQQGEWLNSAVAALGGGGCDEVWVTMGAAVVEPPPGTRAVVVDDWARGLSTGVAAVLDLVRDRSEVAGVVLHVVDMPDVDERVVQRLLSRVGRRRKALARAVFDAMPGHPVYLGADHFDGVRAMLAGDRGAGPYLRANVGEVLTVECADLASGRDIDTQLS